MRFNYFPKEIQYHELFAWMQPWIEGWNPWGVDFLNPYKSLMVDQMHQTDLGIFKHIRECIQRKYQTTRPGVLEEMDRRLQEIKEIHRLGDLAANLPNPPYFRKCVSIPAAKHKAAFQVILAVGHGE